MSVACWTRFALLFDYYYDVFFKPHHHHNHRRLQSFTSVPSHFIVVRNALKFYVSIRYSHSKSSERVSTKLETLGGGHFNEFVTIILVVQVLWCCLWVMKKTEICPFCYARGGTQNGHTDSPPLLFIQKLSFCSNNFMLSTSNGSNSLVECANLLPNLHLIFSHFFTLCYLMFEQELRRCWKINFKLFAGFRLRLQTVRRYELDVVGSVSKLHFWFWLILRIFD